MVGSRGLYAGNAKPKHNGAVGQKNSCGVLGKVLCEVKCWECLPQVAVKHFGMFLRLTHAMFQQLWLECEYVVSTHQKKKCR